LEITTIARIKLAELNWLSPFLIKLITRPAMLEDRDACSLCNAFESAIATLGIDSKTVPAHYYFLSPSEGV
jgi:hypothetical protein